MMIRKFLPLLGLIGGVAILGACDMGGEDKGPPGGTISVSAYTQGTQVYGDASAFFIAELDTSNGSQLSAYKQGFLPDLGNDDCEIIEFTEGGDPLPVPVGLDVGDSVTLETGTASERITLDAYGPSYPGYYVVNAAVDPAAGKAYSITIEGTTDVPEQTWTDKLRMPDLLTLNNFSGSLSINASTGKDISWDAVGADAVLLYFQGSEAYGQCVAADDGSFKIPGEFAGDLGASGYFTISAISESTQDLNGRTVNLGGITGESGTFTVSGAPEPTPTGTPIPGSMTCQIVWMSNGSGANKIHAYLVQLPDSQWTTGTKTYDGSTVIGGLLYDYDTGTQTPADQALAASGTFSLTANGTAIDSDVTFNDSSSQTYQSQVGATVSGGTGSYTGKISDSNSPTPGSGTISMTYNGSTLSIGAAGSYSVCFASFAPMTLEQKLALILASK